MIDTLGVEFTDIHIDRSIYLAWPDEGRKGRKKGSGFTIWHGSTIKIGNSATVQYTYLPYVKGGLLKKEFSLPHVVLGSNVYMVYNLKSAIDQANQMLPNIAGVPPLDLWQGVLYKLDICYNHQVGNLVPYYIKALQFLEYPRRKPWAYGPYGVQFPSKDETFKLYCKQSERRAKRDEAGAHAAFGILRQETEYRKKAVRKLTGLKNPTLQDITVELGLDALENELKELGILSKSIATRKTALKQLCDRYGTRAGVYYFGLLVSKVEQPSKEVIISDTGLHPRSLDRQLEKVVQAGIPLTLTETEEPLPPLAIDRENFDLNGE